MVSYSRQLQPRDVVALFLDDPASGATLGYYGTVVRVESSSSSSPHTRRVRVFIPFLEREVEALADDLVATGSVDESEVSTKSMCSVRFLPTIDDDELTGTYESRAVRFQFTFRHDDVRVPKCELRLDVTSHGPKSGQLTYNVPKNVEINRRYVLRMIGEITGESAAEQKLRGEET